MNSIQTRCSFIYVHSVYTLNLKINENFSLIQSKEPFCPFIVFPGELDNGNHEFMKRNRRMGGHIFCRDMGTVQGGCTLWGFLYGEVRTSELFLEKL
jgi:hypothetical protein